MINAAVGFLAKVVHKADAHKPIMGKSCYLSASLAAFFKNTTEEFDVQIELPGDAKPIKLSKEESMCLIVMNGKYGGGRHFLAPVALLNDGLLDVVL